MGNDAKKSKNNNGQTNNEKLKQFTSTSMGHPMMANAFEEVVNEVSEPTK